MLMLTQFIRELTLFWFCYEFQLHKNVIQNLGHMKFRRQAYTFLYQTSLHQNYQFRNNDDSPVREQSPA
jgi:hypothetical protein